MTYMANIYTGSFLLQEYKYPVMVTNVLCSGNCDLSDDETGCNGRERCTTPENGLCVVQQIKRSLTNDRIMLLLIVYVLLVF